MAANRPASATEGTSSRTAFGAWMKARRTALGLSRKHLAERADCSTNMIDKIEAGLRKPSSQVASALADCFDVPANERRAFVVFARADLSPGTLQELVAANAQAPWRALH